MPEWSGTFVLSAELRLEFNGTRLRSSRPRRFFSLAYFGALQNSLALFCAALLVVGALLLSAALGRGYFPPSIWVSGFVARRCDFSTRCAPSAPPVSARARRTSPAGSLGRGARFRPGGRGRGPRSFVSVLDAASAAAGARRVRQGSPQKPVVGRRGAAYGDSASEMAVVVGRGEGNLVRDFARCLESVLCPFDVFVCDWDEYRRICRSFRRLHRRGQPSERCG